MLRRFAGLAAAAAALAAVPLALAAAPTPYAVQGGPGILSGDGSLRFIAAKAANGDTLVSAFSTSDDSLVRSRTIDGGFGIPALTQGGSTLGGLFHDGSALVLQNLGLAKTSRFAVVSTAGLTVEKRIALKGTFGYDALSPDGSKLYLIQRMSTDDLQHYVVRAYDLNENVLLPGRIADKTQKSWVMQGWAVSRVESPDGRWAYTLYTNPGGYPFIHALDTVRGVAHCVGLPWTTDQTPVWNFSLALNGGSLAVKWQDGHVWRRVNTANWKITKP
ncbi:MAG TPA: hypothetical protein VMJ49_07450 [Gaiellaceae bacterium]|nr:hypothetical protein [Gaiellaceae bacterium]